MKCINENENPISSVQCSLKIKSNANNSNIQSNEYSNSTYQYLAKRRYRYAVNTKEHFTVYVCVFYCTTIVYCLKILVHIYVMYEVQ